LVRAGVDLDFRYPAGTEKNLHTQDQIVKFAREYVTYLRSFLQTNGTTEVYVMEKKLPVKKVTRVWQAEFT